MHPQTEFEPLRGVLSEADEALTAREILSLLDEHDQFDSAHRVATVLGRWAQRGEVEVLRESPYRYRLASSGPSSSSSTSSYS
jgi:predicted Zn-ribbon and HTH transcriptional regulator